MTHSRAEHVVILLIFQLAEHVKSHCTVITCCVEIRMYERSGFACVFFQQMTLEIRGAGGSTEYVTAHLTLIDAAEFGEIGPYIACPFLCFFA